MLNYELFKNLILLGCPLGFVASEFLDEEPPFMAFSSILGRHNLRDLLPVVIIKIFHKFGVFDHEGEEAILEQMGLIILPLG